MADVFTQDELRLLKMLIEEDHLLATIDVTGKPFHRVTCSTLHTRRPDKLILWLEPEGLDDDLETPMEPETPTGEVGDDIDQLLALVIGDAEQSFALHPHDRHYYRPIFKLAQWRGWDLGDRRDPDHDPIVIAENIPGEETDDAT